MSAYLAVLGVSLGISLLLTPISIALGKRWGIVARPGGRRKHKGLIPHLGGIPVLFAFCGGSLFSLAIRSWLPASPQGPDPNELKRFTAIMIGTVLIGLFGLVDDRFELSAKPQYAAQLVVSVVAIVGLVFIQQVGNPFTDEIFEFPTVMVWGLTLLWMMGMMNTVNFLDGLDGLVAGVVGILSGILLVHMLRMGQYGPALLPAALLGTVLGILPFNVHPARIFLGSGAVTLGYLVGTLSLVGGARVATALLVMGIPIVDVAWQIVSRWHQGRSMSDGDRGHLHLRLVDMGVSQRKIVPLYWTFCALFGATALLVSSRMLKLIALILLGLLVIAALAVLSRRRSGPEQEK